MTLPENDTEVLLLHNPNCSKSRATHALLTERGVSFRERRYLEEPLSQEELKDLEGRLGRPIAEWVRPREAAWEAARATPDSEPEVVFAAVAEHPSLLERPIVVKGNQARVGRPPEDVLALFE